MRVLLDTCVIIDALQNRELFANDAKRIFLLAANKQIDGFITAKSVTDIYYLMHHSLHNDKQSRDVLNKLFFLFQVLDTKSSDCINAVASLIPDYEDAVMVETAVREKIHCIVTRNIHDYSQSKIEVLSPKEFLDNLKE